MLLWPCSPVPNSVAKGEREANACHVRGLIESSDGAVINHCKLATYYCCTSQPFRENWMTRPMENNSAGRWDFVKARNAAAATPRGSLEYLGVHIDHHSTLLNPFVFSQCSESSDPHASLACCRRNSTRREQARAISFA